MIAPLLQIFGEPFHEYTHAEEGEAVMGKEYEGKFSLSGRGGRGRGEALTSTHCGGKWGRVCTAFKDEGTPLTFMWKVGAQPLP